MQIKLLIEGGNLTPNPGLSQKIGPLGLNMGNIIKKVNDATQDFKGLKVPVELNIDGTDFDVKVFSPPVSELLKKELGVEKGSGAQGKVKVANASIEQIISVSKTKLPNLLSRNLKTAVKSVVGTCGSLGILIENKSYKEIEEEINEGKYDKEINEEITETSAEKKAKLDEFMGEIKSQQDILLKQEEAAAKEAESAKEAEAVEGEKPKEGEEKKDTLKGTSEETTNK
jgi:large subunit ribosomal protein L11|tara:strand:- start:519 stop:1202 length:684 start_codon:yes stop_codon:yes gene_type:complete